MIKKKFNLSFDLNKLFKNLKLKKHYITELKYKYGVLEDIKKSNHTFLSDYLINNNKESRTLNFNDFLITYVIDICFSKSNTFLNVMDFSGKIKFFYSAGSFKYAGKSKRARSAIFKDFYKVLVTKLKFLKGKPIALHFKNVRYKKKIIKILQKKFFIKCVKSFNVYPYNGCRKRKIKRKKIRSKKRRNG